MVKPDQRIESYSIREQHDGAWYEMHYYTRFIGDDTELWLFGNGMGDQTTMQQLGDCFLILMDQDMDPGLGRIMMSVGNGSTAYRNYYGDHVVAWVWGLTPDQLEGHLSSFTVKPSLVLTPYDEMKREAETLGYSSLHFYAGVAPRLFKPLGATRHGLGYAGNPKSSDQHRIVLQPAMDHGDFEWLKYKEARSFLTIPEYNKWLNGKQIVFGMVDEDRHDITFVPTRFFESIASGTPIILYRVHGLKENAGIDYPYLTTSSEKTSCLINEILGNYDKVHEKVLEWSNHIRERNSYMVRLESLFRKLEMMN